MNSWKTNNRLKEYWDWHKKGGDASEEYNKISKYLTWTPEWFDYGDGRREVTRYRSSFKGLNFEILTGSASPTAVMRIKGVPQAKCYKNYIKIEQTIKWCDSIIEKVYLDQK